MALIDTYASQKLRELREEQGLSPEALAAQIAAQSLNQGWGGRGTVDAHTIRRVERYGHVPSTRVRFVLASYFGLRPSSIWLERNSVPAVAA